MAGVHFPEWQQVAVEERGFWDRSASYIPMSLPYWLYTDTEWQRKCASRQSVVHNGDGKSETKKKECDKEDKAERQWEERDWGVLENREKAAQRVINDDYVCACVCMCVSVCDVHCCVSQLWAMGSLAGLSFVSSWDGVFRLSAPRPATLLPLAKTLSCFITTTITTAAAAAGGGGKRALTPEMQSVCGK